MKKSAFLLALAVLALLAAWAIWDNVDTRKSANKAHGIIDVRESTLSFERGGRISNLNVDEGEEVGEGQVLATLDTAALTHQRAIKKAECDALAANYAELSAGYRKEERDMAASQAAASENIYKLALVTHERISRLAKTKSVSEQAKDEAFFNLQKTRAELDRARKNLAMVNAGYRAEQIEAARAQSESCEKNLAYLDYQIDSQSVIKSPLAGQIRARLHELGDTVNAGAGVFELVQTHSKRVRCYVSENQLKFVKPGGEAKIIATDGAIADGKVAFVSASAEFTPRSVQTEELRADLVWEVRVDFEDAGAAFRLGQPVSVEFR